MFSIKKRKALKQTNRKVILNILRNSGEMSIAELSKKVSLSKPTLMNIINYYLGKGLFINAGKGDSTEEGGKKPNIYKFNKDGGYAIGMIISANKLSGAITNLKSKIVTKKSVTLKTNEKFDAVLDKIINIYSDLIEANKIDRSKLVGLAIGAYGITNINSGEVIFSPHFPSWGKNLNLKEKILEKIPDEITVIVDNHSRFQVLPKRSWVLEKKKTTLLLFRLARDWWQE